MEALDRIMKQIHSGTSQASNSKPQYKCNKCRDIGMILLPNGNAKECECVIKEKAMERWRKSGIDPHNCKKLSEYKPYNEPTKKAREIAIDYLTNFEAIRKQKNNWFALVGQAGAGKTHVVLAIGVELLNRGIETIYMPYVQVKRELQASIFDVEYFNNMISKYLNTKVLIIDDLFKDNLRNGEPIRDKYGNVNLSKQEMDIIYMIFNHRYANNLPTIISSECTVSVMKDIDEALTGRMVEKCGNYIIGFKKGNNDYRLKRFEGD